MMFPFKYLRKCFGFIKKDLLLMVKEIIGTIGNGVYGAIDHFHRGRE